MKMKSEMITIMSNTFFQTSLGEVKKAVLESLKHENVQIILFGSAARDDVHRDSDIDIGYLPKGDYERKSMILLKEKLENMNIPYTVELVDLSTVSELFLEIIFQEGEVWKS